MADMDGHEAPTTIRWIAVDHLRFDPENPRLPRWIDGESEQAVLEWMLQDATLLELMGSIGAQGYFPGEPILVIPANEPQDAFIAIEGNRRVAAARLLSSPTQAPTRRRAVSEAAGSARYRPDSIPCLVFPGRENVLDYLGYRHVTGVKEWGPLEKARYVKQLLQRPPAADGQDRLAEIARKLGSRRDYIARLLAALRVYDDVIEGDFFGLRGVDERTIEFSLLTTALSYENIYRFVGLDSAADDSSPIDRDSLRELVQWVYAPIGSDGRTVVGESRNLRRLAAVVASDSALEALRSRLPLEDAVRLTEEPLNAFRNTMSDAEGRLDLAQKQLRQLEATNESDSLQASRVATMASDIKTLVQSRRTTSAPSDNT